VGGGTAADVQFINQSLPSAAPPNNVLAAFWSDLNPATATAGGGVRVGTLTDGTNTWLVVDFERVPNFSSAAQVNSFQVWIGLAPATGTQDITYAYGAVTAGDGNLLTVGAENFLGNRGANYYFNGTGTAVAAGTQLEVTGAAGAPGETKTITIGAKGDNVGTSQLRGDVRPVRIRRGDELRRGRGDEAEEEVARPTVRTAPGACGCGRPRGLFVWLHWMKWKRSESWGARPWRAPSASRERRTPPCRTCAPRS